MVKYTQIVGNLPTICLSVFDHFMNLALKGLKNVLSVFIITIKFKKSLHKLNLILLFFFDESFCNSTIRLLQNNVSELSAIAIRLPGVLFDL